MVTDAGDESTNGIVASLPTSAQFQASLPTGFSLNGNISTNKAAFKALGFTGLDTAFGASDGSITFSSNFNFDYDNSNGVGAGLIDFETVAAHEIGHLLGFVSEVDTVDVLMANNQTASVAVGALDLFRFQNGSVNDPTTAAQFTTAVREMRPRVTTNGDLDHIFDDTTNEYRFSTGRNRGDGQQASHWKDDGVTGTRIGIMDPTIGNQEVWPISEADFRALNLIGYEVAIIPEPTSVALFGLGSLGLLGAILRRKRNT